jgi:hypothetical protein
MTDPVVVIEGRKPARLVGEGPFTDNQRGRRIIDWIPHGTGWLVRTEVAASYPAYSDDLDQKNGRVIRIRRGVFAVDADGRLTGAAFGEGDANWADDQNWLKRKYGR